jgi:hypothetical protein
VAILAKEIRAAGATPALLAAWPMRHRWRDVDAAIESYRLAAADVEGTLLPVAATWREALRAAPDTPLHGPDGLHPDVAGSWLTALVLVEGLSGKPASLPADAGLPEPLRATLRSAAEAARRR